MLFMSRVHPKKGLLELAKAWMQMKGSHADWELVIAGPEQDKGYTEKVRAELKGEGVWTGELGGEEKWDGGRLVVRTVNRAEARGVAVV